MTPEVRIQAAGRPARGPLARRPSVGGRGADLHGHGRRPAARLGLPRADARPPRRGAALGARPARRARARARRDHRRPGRADGEGRARGDLSLGLAGRGRREPRRQHLSRPEPLPREQRADLRQAAEQRAAARRPDRLVGGAQRHALVRADPRRRGGRLRRPAQRLRADAGDDRGRCRGRPLRGPARVGEEVRPPRRQGARAHAAVRSHAERGAPRGGRARRADGARRPHGRAVGRAPDERRRRVRPRVRHRRADAGRLLPRPRTGSTRRSRAGSRTRRTPT